MGVTDAPQWLLPAFARSLKALGATAPAEQVRSRGEALVERWSTPDRRFHNLRHLIDMLARVDELADESHSPDVMRIATWYHGCVFSAAADKASQGQGGEDEEASAALASAELRELGVPGATADRVASLILNLRRHTLAADDMDAMALGDADLGMLAADPQTYKEYLRLLREEYAHIPQAGYLRARLTIVGRLLEREHLFHSPLGQRWEPPARQNLEAEMQRLQEKLARLTPHEAEQCACTPAPPPAASLTAGAEQDQRSWTTPERSRCSLTEEPDDDRLSRGSATPSVLGHSAAAEKQADADDVLQPAAAQASPASAPSASSPRTPARGVPRLVPSPASRPASRSRAGRSGSEQEELALGTSMESCAADLDRLLSSPRAGEDAGSEPGLDRSAQAEAERERLAERLRAKTHEAKELREARTGELAPITEEIIDDGAARL